MRGKPLVTLALGMFVVIAVIAVGWQSLRTIPATPPAKGGLVQNAVALPAPGAAASSSSPAEAAGVPSTAPPEIVPPAVEASSPPPPLATTPPTPAAQIETTTARPRSPVTPQHKVIAMYFHGDIRCATCRKVEAYAREAVEEGFKEQVAAGTVEFRPVNVDRDENRHFIQDYQLVNKSVVVTEEVDGKVERWVKLDNVWGLVGNHDAYMLYIQDAVRAYAEN